MTSPDPTIDPRAQAYVDDMARRRGYVLDYHRTMARADFPVLEAANGSSMPPTSTSACSTGAPRNCCSS